MAESKGGGAAESVSPPKNTTTEQRRAKRKISTTGLQYLKREVERMKPNELSAANRLYTYELMLLDPDVSTPYNKTKEMVEQAFSSYSIEYNKVLQQRVEEVEKSEKIDTLVEGDERFKGWNNGYNA